MFGGCLTFCPTMWHCFQSVAMKTCHPTVITFMSIMFCNVTFLEHKITAPFAISPLKKTRKSQTVFQEMQNVLFGFPPVDVRLIGLATRPELNQQSGSIIDVQGSRLGGCS